MQSTPFQLSGQAGRSWLLPVISVVAASVSAFVYAWINVYSPIGGYVSILFVLMLAAGAALPVAWAGRRFHVRNVMVLRMAGLTTGLATVYLSWAFFLWVMIIQSGTAEPGTLWHLVNSPTTIWGAADALSVEGWYTIRNATPKGAVLWAFWGIEAALVIGACVMLAPQWVLGRGYCEDCGSWMQAGEALAIPVSKQANAQAVQKSGLAGIAAIESADGVPAKWLTIAPQSCPGCEAAVFRVDEHTVTQTKKGQDTKSREVTPLAWQSADERAHIGRIGGLIDEAAASQEARQKAAQAAANPSE